MGSSWRVVVTLVLLGGAALLFLPAVPALVAAPEGASDPLTYSLGTSSVLVPPLRLDSGGSQRFSDFVGEQVISQLVEEGVKSGTLAFAAEAGAKKALAWGLGRAAGFFFNILTADELILVGNPTTFELRLVSEEGLGKTQLTVTTAQAVLPVVACDFGDERAVTSVSMEILKAYQRPLGLLGWTPVESIPLVTDAEGSELLFGTTSGSEPARTLRTGKFLLVPKVALQFRTPGNYTIRVKGQATASAVVTVKEAARASPPSAVPAADAVDLVFVIDTTSSMNDDIDAVKASASSIIDGFYKSSPSVRLALVAYRDYGDEYVTRAFAFTEDREAMRRNILGLTVAGGGDPPEAVYDALLEAIYTKEIGPWRSGVKKVVILMGDAPPHTRKHTEDEVVKAAAEVDPAHVFPIAVAGAGETTRGAFSALAERTGGAMGTTATAAELPGVIARMVELGSRIADAETLGGRVVEVMGGSVVIGVDTPGSVLPGMFVLVFSPGTPGLLVADGVVVVGESPRFTVDLRAGYGTETPRVGAPVRVTRALGTP